MKKIYLLGLALTMFSMANAQTTVIDDGFESYELGSYNGGHWDNWELSGPNESLDINVSDVRAASGDKSGYIGPQNDDNGQDVLLKMPNVYTKGKVTMEWKMYVPSDSAGYFNLQETSTPGGSFGFQCYINVYTPEDTLNDGTSLANKLVWTYSKNDTGRLYAFAPLIKDQWFTVTQVIDLDNLTFDIAVDAVAATYFQGQENTYPGVKKSIAAIDFFSYADTAAPNLYNGYYIDDIKVTTENVNGISNVEKNSNLVSLYPNPSKDYINLSIGDAVINNVEIFNVTGQKVLSATPNASSIRLNIEGFASGIYTTRITSKDKVYTKEFVVK